MNPPVKCFWAVKFGVDFEISHMSTHLVSLLKTYKQVVYIHEVIRDIFIALQT